jgi:hypothetical protein
MIVLPNFNWGSSIDPVNQGYPSSSGLPVLLFKGQVTPFHSLIVPRESRAYYGDDYVLIST